MAISLQIDEPFTKHLDPELIEKALTVTLQFIGKDQNSLVSVIISDAEQIRSLNRQYRGLDAPTDVLSFENVPDPDFPNDPLQDSAYLGDLIIAYPVAEAQAISARHTPSEEVALLTVHGTLHLLGFDHDTAEHKKEMWAAQGQIMTQLGLGHVQPTES